MGYSLSNLFIHVTFILLLTTPFYSLAMEPETPKLIEQLKKKYDIKDSNSCRIAINKSVFINRPLEEKANLQIACVIVGFKNVYMFTFANELSKMDPEFKKFIDNKTIHYITLRFPKEDDPTVMKEDIGFIYNNVGEHDALLLALYSLKHEQSKIDSNTYLIGKLLGYAEEDLEFFAQISDFFFMHEKELKAISPNIEMYNFSTWPKKAKSMFNSYVKKDWPNSQGDVEFNYYKKIAIKWIAKYSTLSPEQLKQKIKRELDGLIANIKLIIASRLRDIQHDKEKLEAMQKELETGNFIQFSN
jgi:hypothetical protein